MTEQVQDQNASENQPQQEQPQEESRTFTQDDMNKVAGERAKEAEQRYQRKLLEQAGYDSEEALIEAAREQREAQEATKTELERRDEELSTLKDRISEYELVQERNQTLEETLKGYLDNEREGLPEHITGLLDRMDVVDQLSWINNNREAIAESQRPASVGRGSSPGRQDAPNTYEGQMSGFLGQTLNQP